MKTVYMQELPNCDFCGNMAEYDAPSRSGSWANMCRACFLTQTAAGLPSGSIGNKLKQRTPAPAKEGRPVTGNELSSIEEQVMDGDREIGCPACSVGQSVEPDAEYTYTCEGCGVTV